jgi:uncharacterized protein (TIGR00730 family)
MNTPKNNPNTNPNLAYENKNFMQSAEARVVRISSEFLHPAKSLTESGISNTVVFFGSARLKPESPHYQKARELAERIAAWGLTHQAGKVVVATGGGPGIMEAANLGAAEANAQNIGFGIRLPFEQANNVHVTNELSFAFKYFFIRKFWLAAPSLGFTAFPGGFGTMDELFEILTLMQTGKMRKIPVVLFGKKFWETLFNFEFLVEEGLINREDLDLFLITDSVDEAFDRLTRNANTLVRRNSTEA